MFNEKIIKIVTSEGWRVKQPADALKYRVEVFFSQHL